MRILLAVAVLSIPLATTPQQRGCNVEVRYLANEGVLVSAGDKKVLIDAAFRQAMSPYANHEPAIRMRLEAAQAEFAGVDLVLATHRHADHFDAASVAQNLRSNPGALFIAAEETANLVRAADATRAAQLRPVGESGKAEVEHAGIRVEPLRLLHSGRKAWAEPQHLAFLIDIGGKRVLHAGDAEGSIENFRRCAQCPGVDIALLPYWYAVTPSNTRMLREYLKPKSLVLIHVPPGELEELTTRLTPEFPGVILFPEPLSSRCF